MLKYLALPILALTLTACGRGADDYVGYWREQQDKGEEILEIKKEDGNYFAEELINKTDFFGLQKKAVVLNEKDGKLSMNADMGEIVLNLSDDGKTLYMANQSYTKVGTDFKEKVLAHEQDCRKLSEEYKTELNQLSWGDPEYKVKNKELSQKFKTRFAELEKEVRCNSKPLGVMR